MKTNLSACNSPGKEYHVQDVVVKKLKTTAVVVVVEVVVVVVVEVVVVVYHANKRILHYCVNFHFAVKKRKGA